MTIVDHATGAASKGVSLAANTGIFGGAFGAVGGWLAGQDAVAWIGVFIGLGGLTISYFHKRALRRLEREKLEFEREKFDWMKRSEM